jgi:hypothetical protein
MRDIHSEGRLAKAADSDSVFGRMEPGCAPALYAVAASASVRAGATDSSEEWRTRSDSNARPPDS